MQMVNALWLFAILALAGCAAPPDPEPVGEPAHWRLSFERAADRIHYAPFEARAVFEAIERPFEMDLTVPEGTTLVRATFRSGDAAGGSVVLRHAETERRRCHPSGPASWFEPTGKESTCAAVALVDDLPAPWRVEVPGSGSGALEIVFSAAPLAGAAANLDIAQLSLGTHEVAPTESFRIASWDGTLLRVDVTRPVASEPVPVVIASGPYNQAQRTGNEPAMYRSFVLDWATRGYAIVVADIRGTGGSEGCIDIWGAAEQRDQAVLVEWAADQPWSDGNVAFYGQSYLGTAALEAAAAAPDALKAVIAVAPVPDMYLDWHFGGVPNGEGIMTPVNYGVYEGTSSDGDATEPLHLARTSAGGACAPLHLAQANDPRAIYSSYYAERNLTTRAANVRAAVLHTQGYFDLNVKSASLPPWFNALTSPKLGLMGPWGHQHPSRADTELLFLAWLDEHLRGKDMGLSRLPTVLAQADDERELRANAWPSEEAPPLLLYPSWDDSALGLTSKPGRSILSLTPPGVPSTPIEEGERLARLSMTLQGDVAISGAPSLRLAGVLDRAQNAHVAAFLYDETEGHRKLVTFGMANLAHRFGHDRYVIATPGEALTMDLGFQPVSYVLPAGHDLVLEIRATATNDWLLARPAEPGTLTLEAGQHGTLLHLPAIGVDKLHVMSRPLTSGP